MALTAAAGLPQLVTRGSNADEGMRKLWAMDSAQARRFLKARGQTLSHRVLIKDGNDDQCVSLGYDEAVIKDLRKRILITSKPATSAQPSTLPGADDSATLTLGGLTVDSSAGGTPGGAPASELPADTPGGAAVERQGLNTLDLFDISCAL